MKRIIEKIKTKKKLFIGIISGGIFISIIGVVGTIAANNIASNYVLYDSPTGKTNVKDAIDELYTMSSTHCPDGKICSINEGDLNHDGVISDSDKFFVRYCIMNNRMCNDEFDINGDGKVGNADIVRLTNLVSSEFAKYNVSGDSDSSGNPIVDESDVELVQGYINNNQYVEAADFNGDNVVNIYDLLLIKRLVYLNSLDTYDLDHDGVISNADRSLIHVCMADNSVCKDEFDIDDSGDVNIMDLILLQNIVSENRKKYNLSGDLDSSGNPIVDKSDVELVQEGAPRSGYNETMDFNYDGIVDYKDLSMIKIFVNSETSS